MNSNKDVVVCHQEYCVSMDEHQGSNEEEHMLVPNPVLQLPEIKVVFQASHREWVKLIAYAGSTDAATESTPSPPLKPPLIRMVPKKLRDKKDVGRYYDPSIVALGPYHYLKDELQQVQKLKLKIMSKFVAKSGLGLEDLCDRLLVKFSRLRDCYEVGSTADLSDEAFARMMLMDGCFILYYIECIVTDSQKDLEMESQEIELVQKDLFLLENQLPFSVLVEIKSSTKGDANWMDMIYQFGNFDKLQIIPPKKRTGIKFAHLLHFLHIALVGELPKSHTQTNYPYTRRNVKELMTAGIHFKPSNTSRLTDIRYVYRFLYANLKLPPITVDNSTRPKLVNLIAYEMCSNDSRVTSYVCFIASLIKQSDDVKELWSARILHNCLSDDEAANLFKEIGKDLIPNPYAYADVKRDIQNHYAYRGMSWWAQLYLDYFKSPWSILALAGALLALFLTGVQTYFALPGDCDSVCEYIRKNHHI